MFEFFDMVGGFLDLLWQYVSNMFSSLLLAVTFLATSLSFPQMLIAYMPPIIGSAILIFMAVYVVRFLIGK